MLGNIDILVKFSPFDTLSREYNGKILEKIEVKSFEKGQLLYRRGKKLGQSFYLVSGEIDLIASDFSVIHLEPNSPEAKSALNNGSTTVTSAVAKSDVQVYILDKDFLDLVMAWSQSSSYSMTGLKHQQAEVTESDGDWMSSLLQSPLFTQIPPANIQKLFTRFEEMNVSQDEVVVKEGEVGDYFYVIESGIAAVASRLTKTAVTLDAGRYFGEEALIGDTTRNATVTMPKGGVLHRLEKEDFKALLQEPVQKFTTAKDIAKAMAAGETVEVIDVRLPIEHKMDRVEHSRNIPLGSLRNRLPELKSDVTYAITGNGGRRSELAAYLMCQAGLDAYILS